MRNPVNDTIDEQGRALCKICDTWVYTEDMVRDPKYKYGFRYECRRCRAIKSASARLKKAREDSEEKKAKKLAWHKKHEENLAKRRAGLDNLRGNYPNVYKRRPAKTAVQILLDSLICQTVEEAERYIEHCRSLPYARTPRK